MNSSIIGKIVAIALWVVSSTPYSAGASEVTAEGMAPGDSSNARELALSDALREAVRQGVGINITSSTGVSDFTLDYDRVFSAAFGHVRSYSVLEFGLGDDEIYRVKVKAEVQKGEPGVKDELALRQLIAMKQSPRIALQISEKIDGVSRKNISQAWFEESAGELHLNLVDVGSARSQESKLAARDNILGNERSAAFREANISQKADFIIEVTVNGRYVGKKALYGGLPQHVFSLGAELRALRPETGEIVASVTIPPREELGSDLENAEMAAVDLARRMLQGVPDNADAPSGWTLFRKILARWTTEIDLGRLIRVELSGLDRASLDKLLTGLQASDNVSATFLREFDAQASSMIDVETRMNSIDLGELVAKSSAGSLALDRGTDSYLLFAPSSSLAGHTQNITGTTNASGGVPAWIFIVVVAVGFLVLLCFCYWVGGKLDPVTFHIRPFDSNDFTICYPQKI